jgi:hypothetical protein
MNPLAILGGLLLALSPQEQSTPPGPSGPSQPAGRQPAEKKFSELRIRATDREHKPVDLTLATGAILVRPKSGPAKMMNLSIVIADVPPELPSNAPRAEFPAESGTIVHVVVVPPPALDMPKERDPKGPKDIRPKAPHAEPEKVKPMPPATNAYFKAEIETPENDPAFSAEVTLMIQGKETTVRFDVPFKAQEKSSLEDPSRKVK